VHASNDLRQHLTDARVGVEQSVIDDDIDQWRSRLHAYIRATEVHFEYSLWHNLVKTLLTVKTKLKLLLNKTYVSDSR